MGGIYLKRLVAHYVHNNPVNFIDPTGHFDKVASCNADGCDSGGGGGDGSGGGGNGGSGGIRPLTETDDLAAETEAAEAKAYGSATTSEPEGTATGDQTSATSSESTNQSSNQSLDFSKVTARNQLAKRGWTTDSVQKLIATATDTMKVVDKRWPPGASAPVNERATVYFLPGSNGNQYVVVNDQTGLVVQVSDLNDPNWIPTLTPWGGD